MSVRRKQMEELLNDIRDAHNPAVVAGDLNSTGSNGTPTSVSNMLYKRYGSTDFWANKRRPVGQRSRGTQRRRLQGRA